MISFETIYYSFYSELNDIPSQPSLLLVVKWGGQLTQTGRTQAEILGKVIKCSLACIVSF